MNHNMRMYWKKAVSTLNLFGRPENYLSRLFSAYFMISCFQVLSVKLQEIDPVSDWKTVIAVFPLASKLLWTIFIFLCLSILYLLTAKKHPGIDHIILMASVLMFSFILVCGSGSFYLGLASAAVAVIFISYALGKINQNHFEHLPDLSAGIIIFSAALMMFVYIAVTCIAKYFIFGTPCFDMGVFVQTFHSMKEHLTAVITCERGEMMSHFKVHSSYIFYLFLPIYMLVPKAETLLVAQAFFVAAGVIPLFLLAKKHGFQGSSLISICFLYVFYGGLIMPCYFNFHENAFLPTILMWLLYAMDQEKIPLFYIMSVLTCIVKEDAPLYVICIAFFFFIEKKDTKRKHGLIIAVLSIAYFIFTTKWLIHYGDGAYMTATRIGHLMTGYEEGFAGIIRNMLVNPAYFISLILQKETLLFFVQTMLPLLFLPFLTRKLHRFLLIIPYVLMNLMIGAGYGYTANIGFQYIFGPSCLLIYMALRNVEDLPKKHRTSLLITAAIISTITTISMVSGKFLNVEHYSKNKEYYQSAEACIQLIPDDASVLADTYLLPHIAYRDQIYELNEDCFIEDEDGNTIGMTGLDTYDFCVFKGQNSLTELAMPFLEKAGWTVYARSEEDFLIIFVNPSFSQ